MTAVALATRGGRALSGSSDQTARLWDLRNGAGARDTQRSQRRRDGGVVDDEGVVAATGSADRTIKLWRLDSCDRRYCAPHTGEQ